MSDFRVPIKNALFMYSYVWDRVGHQDLTKLASEDSFSSVDVYAELFLLNVEKIIRKGLYQDYNTKNEELKSIKGRIDFQTTLKKQSLISGKVYCHYDEYEENNIYNQMLKAIALRLYKSADINSTHKKKLMKIILRLNQIELIELSPESFNKLEFNNSNKNYYMILKVCKLIYDTLMLTDVKGKYSFYDLFNDDKIMETVFELFINKFYKYELSGKYSVGYQNQLHHQMFGGDQTLLPVMKMDTLVSSDQKTYIIDTKYYEKYYDISFGRKILKSSHIYQMESYMNNIRYDNELQGILLYPKPYNDDGIDQTYNTTTYSITDNTPKHTSIRFYTIDLSKDWFKITSDLLSLIEPQPTGE